MRGPYCRTGCEHPSFLCSGFENTMLEPVPNFLSHEARRLKEYFGRWKRVSKL